MSMSKQRRLAAFRTPVGRPFELRCSASQLQIDKQIPRVSIYNEGARRDRPMSGLLLKMIPHSP